MAGCSLGHNVHSSLDVFTKLLAGAPRVEEVKDSLVVNLEETARHEVAHPLSFLLVVWPGMC